MAAVPVLRSVVLTRIRRTGHDMNRTTSRHLATSITADWRLAADRSRTLNRGHDATCDHAGHRPAHACAVSRIHPARARADRILQILFGRPTTTMETSRIGVVGDDA